MDTKILDNLFLLLETEPLLTTKKNGKRKHIKIIIPPGSTHIFGVDGDEFNEEQYDNVCFNLDYNSSNNNLKIEGIKDPYPQVCDITGTNIMKAILKLAKIAGVETISLHDASKIYHPDYDPSHQRSYSLLVYSLLKNCETWYEKMGFKQEHLKENFFDYLQTIRTKPIVELTSIHTNLYYELNPKARPMSADKWNAEFKKIWSNSTINQNTTTIPELLKQLDPLNIENFDTIAKIVNGMDKIFHISSIYDRNVKLVLADVIIGGKKRKKYTHKHKKYTHKHKKYTRKHNLKNKRLY
jgi:hypothetical protein